MKMKLIIKYCIFWVVCSCLSSCLKDSQDTVLLPLPVGTIYGVDLPEGLTDHIKVHDGIDPPSLEGSFWATPMEVEYASDGYWNGEYYDLYIAFTAMDSRNVTSYREKQNSSSGVSSKARVIGSGNNFTAYTEVEMQDPKEDWWCKVLTIITGTVEGNGIEDFQYANVMLEKRDPYNKLMEVGEYHILHDKDNHVVNYEW